MPAGVHQVVLNDMPDVTAVEAVQARGGEGVGAGAIWLRDGRLALGEPVRTPAQEAAKVALEERQAALDAAQDAADLARAGIESALAEQNFYANVYSDAAISPEALKALGDQVAKGVADAQARLVAAGAALRPLEKAVEKATEARDLAQAALDALPGLPEDRVALSVQVSVDAAGPHALTVTQWVNEAGWMPSYDLYLARKSDAPLTLTRAILVHQETGEDWQGVTMAFSRRNRPANPWPARFGQSTANFMTRSRRGAAQDHGRSRRWHGGHDGHGGGPEPMAVAEAAYQGRCADLSSVRPRECGQRRG